MNKFLVTYCTKNLIPAHALIEASSLTVAYVTFMTLSPSDRMIADIQLTKGEDLPEDTIFPQRPKITYTVCA